MSAAVDIFAGKELVPAEEHKVYGVDKTLWSVMLFLKHSDGIVRWKMTRRVLLETLNEVQRSHV